MNASVFKFTTILLLMSALSFSAGAQKLRFLIPDGAIVQHAGSIGYFSAGIDYDLFKNQRGSLDILYGVLPKSKGGAFSTISAKFAYRPFAIKASPWLVIHPVNPGFFVSYTIDKDFDLTRDRDQYIIGYYYLSEALRSHVSLSTEFKLNTAGLVKGKTMQAVTLYYEINTNDMYLVNYFQNTKEMSLTDVFKAGIGIKASF